MATREATDLVLSAAMLLATLPLLVAMAALVRLSSSGPAIYRQIRLGRRGRPFTIYKLRTMSDGCERESGPRWSGPGDRRVTPLGRLLRASHIDELPQLWNVLKGEMSLIGPRPERPEFARQLARAYPRYAERLEVRPGITGLAQVQLAPDAGLEDVGRKLAYDLCYIRSAGPWLDLRILAGTAMKIAKVPFGIIRRSLWLPVVPEMAPVEHAGHVQVAGSVVEQPEWVPPRRVEAAAGLQAS